MESHHMTAKLTSLLKSIIQQFIIAKGMTVESFFISPLFSNVPIHIQHLKISQRQLIPGKLGSPTIPDEGCIAIEN